MLDFWQFLTWVIGSSSPKIIAYIQNPYWSFKKKLLISIIFHLFIAIVSLGAGGFLSFSAIFASATNVLMFTIQTFIVSFLSYHGFWQKEQVNKKTYELKMQTKHKIAGMFNKNEKK